MIKNLSLLTTIYLISLTSWANSSVKRTNDLLASNPLFDEIQHYFDQHAEDIKRRQLERIDWDGNREVWGGLNHIGLAYSHDFAQFSIELKREVAPDLFDDKRWLVTDTFDIYIDASVLFDHLQQEGSLGITPAQVGAVAGMTFKRSYRFSHFAPTYIEAVTHNLDRFFFSFLNFRSKNFLQLKEGEFLSKEDAIGFHAGILASIPLGQLPLAAHFGALVKYQKLGKVEIHKPFVEDQLSAGDDLRVNYESREIKSFGASAAIVADFLAVMQLSLLSFDYTYALEKSYKAYLRFNDEDQQRLADHEDQLAVEVARILRHQTPDLTVIAPYLVSEERHREETIKTHYAFLYWGTYRDEKTSHIQITKNNVMKTFFRHNFTFKKVRQDPSQWLMESFLKSHQVVNTLQKKQDEVIKNLRFEYDSEYDLLKEQKDLVLSPVSQKVSMHFIRQHKTNVKRENVDLMLKTLNDLEAFGGADPLVIKKFKRTPMRRELSGDINMMVHENGLKYFNTLSMAKLKSIANNLCGASGSGRYYWLCRRYLKRSFNSYIKERASRKVTKNDLISCDKQQQDLGDLPRGEQQKRHAQCLSRRTMKSADTQFSEIPLWKLKKVMQDVLLYSTAKVAYYDLFGLKNVHIYGSLNATGAEFQEIKHHFKEGYFQGIGLISNFKRQKYLNNE